MSLDSKVTITFFITHGQKGEMLSWGVTIGSKVKRSVCLFSVLLSSALAHKLSVEQRTPNGDVHLVNNCHLMIC
jgi:hypothetical protein